MAAYIGSSNYITKQQRETSGHEGARLHLNPWNVQNIVYEIIQNHFITNNPRECGYTFDQQYNKIKEQSQIALEISYNWKADIASKRPAVYVARGNAEIKYPTMGNTVGQNARDSEEDKLALVSLPISVMVAASPVGFAEQLADYVKQPLMYWSQIIQCDFGFQRFRLTSIGKPQIYVEAKDNFVVELALQIEYSDNWIVRGDDLKLKTFSATIFDSVLKKPLENQ